MLIYGDTPIPVKFNRKEKKVKEDCRDIIVPIRMNFEEKNKIKRRAKKVGKQVSTFIRESALRM